MKELVQNVTKTKYLPAMKNHDSSAPINAANRMNDQFAQILSGIIGFVIAGLLFMVLPADAQIIIIGIISLIGAAIAAHLLQEKFNAMSESKEAKNEMEVSSVLIPLHPRDYMVEQRRKLRVA